MVEVWNNKIDYESVHGKASVAQIAELYKGALSKESEPVTESFVDNTITIMQRAILPSRRIQIAIEDCDDMYGINGPFNRQNKLLACVQKSPNAASIEWCILSIIDAFRSKDIPPEGIIVAATNTF